jgi:hypothetical protein
MAEFQDRVLNTISAAIVSVSKSFSEVSSQAAIQAVVDEFSQFKYETL